MGRIWREEGNPCVHSGSVNWCSHYRNQYEGSSKKKKKSNIIRLKKKDYVYVHGCVRCVDTDCGGGHEWKLMAG